MKNNIISYIASAAAVIFGLSACGVDSIDDLDGIYTPPTVINATELVTNERAKDDATGLRTFTIDVSDGTNGLHAVLVGDNWKLGASTYSAADSISKSSTYLTSETYFYVDGTKYTPSSGTIIVKNDGADGYTISAMLFSDSFDGAANIEFSGDIVYEKEYESYTSLIYSSSLLAQGTNAVSIMIGTDGMTGTFDFSTFSWKISGTGKVMTLVIYSSDGSLAAGTYTACPTEGEVTEGTFKYGFLNLQYAAYGVEFADGSYISAYTGGVKSSDTYITDGTIEVAVTDGTYTITVDGTATSARYTGTLTL
jgi:hypothetical protein